MCKVYAANTVVEIYGKYIYYIRVVFPALYFYFYF